MSCRCPVCDQVLIVTDSVTPQTIVCCDRCDRGFRAKDSLCEHCSRSNPFLRRDSLTYVCAGCGILQSDRAEAMTA